MSGTRKVVILEMQKLTEWSKEQSLALNDENGKWVHERLNRVATDCLNYWKNQDVENCVCECGSWRSHHLGELKVCPDPTHNLQTFKKATT